MLNRCTLFYSKHQNIFKMIESQFKFHFFFFYVYNLIILMLSISARIILTGPSCTIIMIPLLFILYYYISFVDIGSYCQHIRVTILLNRPWYNSHNHYYSSVQTFNKTYSSYLGKLLQYKHLISGFLHTIIIVYVSFVELRFANTVILQCTKPAGSTNITVYYVNKMPLQQFGSHSTKWF